MVLQVLLIYICLEQHQLFTMLPYLILPNISDYLMQLYVWSRQAASDLPLSFLNWSLKKAKTAVFLS